MRPILITWFICVKLSLTCSNIFAQQDLRHYSKVFKAERPYRIFLPTGYEFSKKRYPVIYYFHGNKGDHRLQYDSLNELVNKASVIVVAWNGKSVEKDYRPYNIGYHANINYQVQFKDYFLEFVKYVDSTYRTIPNRSHRALMGHSMGGFMSFLLAGKYPHMVGTAVSSKGSPEFFVGYPGNHSLYSYRYMFKNYSGVKLRFHNGSPTEELVNLNNEVHQGALRENDLNYSYKAYDGPHDISYPEFREAFDFIINSFDQPLAYPQRWHHIDLYPDFDIWGYQVNSNLSEPGFIELRGVTKGGMEIRTRKWQPDGRSIPGVQIKVKTAPVYKSRTSYTLLDFNEAQNSKHLSEVVSDEEGRINFQVNHEPHQVGIYKNDDPADVVMLAYKVNDKGIFLDHKKESNLKLQLLNRGGSKGQKLKITLSTSHKGVTIANPGIKLAGIQTGEDHWIPADFKVTASNEPTTDGSPFRVRFNVAITDKNRITCKEEFDAPVFYDVPEFAEIGIDDGDSEIFGSGNGNNIADPGETVMIYQHSHRTRLYYDDPYIESERLYDELQPDKWGDGYALSSLIRISKDCPIGHQIKFLACYEVKEWKTIKRNVTWGYFTITIGKEEQVYDANNKIQYNGRIGMKNTGVAEIYWPGSSIKTRFNGTSLQATLRDQKGFNYYNVIIDDDSIYTVKIDSIKKSYTLVSGLPEGEHTVELYRLTDFNDGITWFYGFQYPPGAVALDVPRKKNDRIL